MRTNTEHKVNGIARRGRAGVNESHSEGVEHPKDAIRDTSVALVCTTQILPPAPTAGATPKRERELLQDARGDRYGTRASISGYSTRLSCAVGSLRVPMQTA